MKYILFLFSLIFLLTKSTKFTKNNIANILVVIGLGNLSPINSVMGFNFEKKQCNKIYQIL